jgi:hypothetical protein
VFHSFQIQGLIILCQGILFLIFLQSQNLSILTSASPLLKLFVTSFFATSIHHSKVANSKDIIASSAQQIVYYGLLALFFLVTSFVGYFSVASSSALVLAIIGMISFSSIIKIFLQSVKSIYHHCEQEAEASRSVCCLCTLEKRPQVLIQHLDRSFKLSSGTLSLKRTVGRSSFFF